jgi:acyl-CoA synthetase (AMP-forming)/AMP-acid ligase II
VASSTAPVQTLPDGDILDRLVELADTSPDKVLYIELLDGVEESARMAAAELRDRAAALAATLNARGLKQGDVALLIATPPMEFLIGLFGCMWAGVIAAPVSFPRRPEHLESRLEPVRANADAVAVVTATPQGQAEIDVLEQLTRGVVPVISITDQDAGQGAEPVTDRDIAYLQYTSGSTSDPRGVIVTHANLASNLDLCRELLAMDEESITVSWCPLTHDMGLVMGALPSLWYGTLSVLMPPGAFIRRPMTWMRAMDRFRGTHGYSPNFGYDLLVDRSTPEDRQALDLSGVKALINGAEPVRRLTRDRFLDAFAVTGIDPGAHTAGYGLAESTVLVSASAPGDPGKVLWVDAEALEQHRVEFRTKGDAGARELCVDGTPGVQYDVRIVDPATGGQLPPDQVGELWLRGPSVCPGYWRREEATREGFAGRLEGDDGGPYLCTGDLAFLHEGEIVICGRAKDLIVIRGRNLYPQDIEVTAELSHDAVRLGGSAAFAVEDETGETMETLVVVAEVNGEPVESEVVEAITAAVLREYELKVSDVLLVPPYTVPKTSSGKKQRTASRRLWHAARGHDAHPVE